MYKSKCYLIDVMFSSCIFIFVQSKILQLLNGRESLIVNLNLRNAIIHNVSGNSQDQLKETIVDAIQNGEEKMLPGLGVLFEVIWKNSSENDKVEMLQTLEDGLK